MWMWFFVSIILLTVIVVECLLFLACLLSSFTSLFSKWRFLAFSTFSGHYIEKKEFPDYIFII